MASTYEPIATTTLGSATAAITFSSIPSTYTDLKIIIVATASVSGSALQFIFNNDSASNYSVTLINGNGVNASSNKYSNQSTGYGLVASSSTGLSTSVPSFLSIDIFSYAGSTFKTALVAGNADKNGSGNVEYDVNLWRSTSAINRIDLSAQSANLSAGTTATLYGIKAA